jgi:hypothetical protein
MLITPDSRASLPITVQLTVSQTVDVVRPVTSGDHAWVTSYSESAWSAAEGERPCLAYVVRNMCVNLWNRVLRHAGQGCRKRSE